MSVLSGTECVCLCIIGKEKTYCFLLIQNSSSQVKPEQPSQSTSWESGSAVQDPGLRGHHQNHLSHFLPLQLCCLWHWLHFQTNLRSSLIVSGWLLPAPELQSVLLSSGCYNKAPQASWLRSNEDLCLTVQEAGSLRSGCPHGRVRILCQVTDSPCILTW